MSASTKDRKRGIGLAVLMIATGFLLLGLALSLFTGAIAGFDSQIFWVLRAPRAFSAIAVGGGLAVAGAMIQAGLGNPLADPYTLGVASAAALGAVLSTLGSSVLSPELASQLPFWAVLLRELQHSLFGSTLLAFLFALGGLFLLASWLRRSFRYATEVLLAGIVASFFFTALATLVLALGDPAAWPSAVSWLMGTLGHLGLTESVAAVVLMVLLSVIAWLHWKPLDLIAVDELSAESAGLGVESFRKRLFVLVALITAVAVSVGGIIGFVGLIVPHLLRRLGLNTHRTLIPACFLTGAGLLLVSDAAARVVARPSEIPVGIVMALIGAPFFLALARKRRAL